MAEPRNVIDGLAKFMTNVVESPVEWFRERVVVPNQKKYPWYHEKLRRVPTVDQCYTDDLVCRYEAEQQFKRDKMVDSEILLIVRKRFEDCALYEAPDSVTKCQHVLQALKLAEENLFSRYGDLGAVGNAKDAYMKQKHRMIWERRHGKIGSGMKTEE